MYLFTSNDSVVYDGDWHRTNFGGFPRTYETKVSLSKNGRVHADTQRGCLSHHICFDWPHEE